MVFYCKKCGRIAQDSARKLEVTCDYCKSVMYPVPKEYTIKEKGTFFENKLKDQFIEEFIKSSPEFDEYLFEHRDQDLFNQHQSDMAKINHGKAVLEGRDKGNSFGVSCPYCHATNVKKISTASRMVSTGFFGLGSKKIGKQWHCSKCGSDF